MKQKDIMFLLISSVILTIAWIVFTVIHKSISSTIAPVTNEQITAIKPDFDDKTITELKKRQNTQPAFSVQTTVSTASAATPTPSIVKLTPTPIPSGPVSLITIVPNNDQDQATSGGQTQ